MGWRSLGAWSRWGLLPFAELATMGCGWVAQPLAVSALRDFLHLTFSREVMAPPHPAPHAQLFRLRCRKLALPPLA